MNDTMELESREATKSKLPVRYVVGFLFNASMNQVALIRKQKPAWQAGLLNGIGGKIEPGETPEMAMRREFGEEAAYLGAAILNWKLFAQMAGTNNDGSTFSIHFFWCIGNPGIVTSREEEQIEVHDVCDLAGGWEATIGNLPWLVAAARDVGIGKYPPKMIRVEY